jgi:hypothetical protein
MSFRISPKAGCYIPMTPFGKLASFPSQFSEIGFEVFRIRIMCCYVLVGTGKSDFQYHSNSY